MTAPAALAKPRILYIAGSAHSGSTLLDLLLSSHPEVVSVGELKVLGRWSERRCTCGARPFLRCPFWSQVDERLAGREAAGLREAEVLGAATDRFTRDNRALFEAVSEVTGRSWIVDSSKSPKRLESLLASDAFDLLPVHLIREPAGVVYSHVRKGRDWVQAALKHRRTNRRVASALAGRKHLTVRYEDLALDTETELRRILAHMGLVFEPSQLQWAGRVRHNLGGNRVRRSRGSEIRIDRRWKQELGLLRRAGVHLMAGAALRTEAVRSRDSGRRLPRRSS